MLLVTRLRAIIVVVGLCLPNVKLNWKFRG